MKIIKIIGTRNVRLFSVVLLVVLASQSYAKMTEEGHRKFVAGMSGLSNEGVKPGEESVFMGAWKNNGKSHQIVFKPKGVLSIRRDGKIEYGSWVLAKSSSAKAPVAIIKYYGKNPKFASFLFNKKTENTSCEIHVHYGGLIGSFIRK